MTADRVSTLPRRCRVCGDEAALGWPDGWYCASDECIERRQWGRLLDPRGARAGSCAPLRCYCGQLSCASIDEYVISNPAPVLWRTAALDVPAEPPTGVAVARAAALAARARGNVRRASHEAPEPRVAKLRQAWDTREQPTWMDRD